MINVANQNIHTLYICEAPLCVLCQTCNRRSLVEVTKICRWDGKGNMTPIKEVARRLKCIDCNIKNSYAFVPPNRAWAGKWITKQLGTPGID